MIVVVECLDPMCPKRLHDGSRQRVGRVMLLDGHPTMAEFFCPKCREARWYSVGSDGRVALAVTTRVLSTA